MGEELPLGAYADLGGDEVRQTFEVEHLEVVLSSLLEVADGSRLLDLGCADGLVERLGGARIEEYVGIDLFAESPYIRHDLRDGLGPVGTQPFDVYLASFGLASHLTPGQLAGLVAEIAAHAAPGALVALEALGVGSLEWPRLWDVEPGERRAIPYWLGADVSVHPWAPEELAELLRVNGVKPLHAIDRTVQPGPKLQSGRYWPGLPPLRGALNALLSPDSHADDLAAAREILTQPLPPLPAGPAAVVHQALVASRTEVLAAGGDCPRAQARAIWELEPHLGQGFGHGLLLVGRVA